MNLRFDRRTAMALVSRTLAFAATWWMLTEGAAGAWGVGVPAVLLASAASIALLPPARSAPLVWSELLRFLPFFVWRSLLGGVDVARRVLHPRLPIAPDLVSYPLRLPAGLPRTILIGILNLLPGTLGVRVQRGCLIIHVLDRHQAHDFERVEARVARLFALSLPPSARAAEKIS